METNHKYTNELIHESSPYLLQHAHNPVKWQAWNDETLAEAKETDKLLLISIGYAACHWCHVMEHESFEDEEVAELMNKHFIPIKIDREERPDVDDVYMTACQMMTGRGGWPLNAVALPDGRPIFAGTYYPKDQWMQILNQLIEVKTNNPDKIKSTADNIQKGMEDISIVQIAEDDDDLTDSELSENIENVVNSLDFNLGGSKGAPKFPMPNIYELLMKYDHHFSHEQADKISNVTLKAMGYGGIFDQIGGGFARYSVDAEWFAPHFEKMLYDNGQLLSIYAQAYQKTQNPFYLEIIEKTTSFLERELLDESNGFYSSLDADSEGEEGKYYLWTENEIDSLLSKSEAKLIKTYYNTVERGNFEHSNILHIRRSLKDVSTELAVSIEEAEKTLSDANSKLFAERENRIRPGLDDKILCDWNGLIIKGYLDAYQATGDQKYYNQAKKSLEFVLSKMKQEDGGLYRNYKSNQATINGFLSDYATIIDALIAIYQNDFDIQWLNTATALLDHVKEHFDTEEEVFFYYTSSQDDPLIIRRIEHTDNVIPASNSMMARNLFTLGNLLYKPEWIARSKKMLASANIDIRKTSSKRFFSNWLQLYLDFSKPPYEIAIVGPKAQELRLELAKHYLGNAIILGTEKEENLDLLKGKFQEDQTLIYVCQNRACKFPVDNVDKALALLD